ncbi:MAG: serine hydrolase domain-containing protein, partial [Actinomycetota bacterium]
MGGALVAGALAVAACSSDDTPTESAAASDGAGTGAEPAASIDFPDPEWTTVTPAEAGFDADALDEAVAAAEESGSHCLAVTRDGRLVGEWNFGDWTSEDTTLFFSATKSMSSTLVGIAQDDGVLDLDDPASDFIAEWRGTDSEDVTVRDLLSNDSGRFWSFTTDYQEMVFADDSTAYAVGLDQQFEPGEDWEYNNSAIQSLEAVLEAALDEDPADYANRRFVEPLGMDGEW